MGDPKNPKVGDRVIDASEVKLVDLTIGQTIKTAKVRDGFEQALEAFNLVDEAHRESFFERIKVSKSELSRINAVHQNWLQAQALVAPLEKLLELAKETMIANGGEIAVFITDSCKSARDRAKREDEGTAPRTEADLNIEATLEKPFVYQYGPGQQGAQTRAEQAKATEPTKPE